MNQLSQFKEDASRANALRESIRQLEADNEILEADFQRSQTALEKFQGFIFKLRDFVPKELERFRKSLSDSRKQALNEQHSVTTFLRSLTSEIVTSVSSLTAKCDRLESDRTTLEQINKQASSRISEFSSLQNSYVRSREEVSLLLSKLNKTEEELMQVKEKFKIAEKNNLRTEIQVRNLQDQLKSSEEEFSQSVKQLQLQIKAVQTEVNALSVDNDQLRELKTVNEAKIRQVCNVNCP